MTYLLSVDGRPGVSELDHILKATTIFSLTTEVAKGQANFPQLAIKGNYRAVAAQEVDKVYSRNIAHRHLSVSDFAQSAFRKNTSLESAKKGPPISPGGSRRNETASCGTEFQDAKPREWALKLLANVGMRDVLEMAKRFSGCIRGEAVAEVQKIDPSGKSCIPNKGVG